MGSSLRVFGGGGAAATATAARVKEDHGKAKLDAVRGADIVVATAGAFEHCMCKVRPAADLMIVPCLVVRVEARGRWFPAKNVEVPRFLVSSKRRIQMPTPRCPPDALGGASQASAKLALLLAWHVPPTFVYRTHAANPSLPTRLQDYIDPDSICCVVLDEAHHCGKEHPFNRVARSFLTMKAFPTASATPRRASELPKVVCAVMYSRCVYVERAPQGVVCAVLYGRCVWNG